MGLSGFCCRNNSAVSLNSRSANQHPTFVTADCSSSSSCQSSRVPLTFCHAGRCIVASLHSCTVAGCAHFLPHQLDAPFRANFSLQMLFMSGLLLQRHTNMDLR